MELGRGQIWGIGGPGWNLEVLAEMVLGLGAHPWPGK